MITIFSLCHNMLKSMFVFFCGKYVWFYMLHFGMWPCYCEPHFVWWGRECNHENNHRLWWVNTAPSLFLHIYQIYQETRFSRINITSTLAEPLERSKPNLILFFMPGEIGKPWLEQNGGKPHNLELFHQLVEQKTNKMISFTSYCFLNRIAICVFGCVWVSKDLMAV